MTFFPEEIIFAATEACNLHCPHCFVSRNPEKLDITQALTFMDSCKAASEKNPELPSIQKIGFSGGEPFLYFDFIIEITKYVLKNDLMFDQIMTNGDWWKNESDLTEKLQLLYDTGYDGHIGLSWDIFHNQETERIQLFINKVMEIFGSDSINIQTVIPHKALFKEAKTSPDYIDSKKYKRQLKDIRKTEKDYGIPVYYLQQSFPYNHPLAWTGKKWFTEDYCEGPGHVLYVHPTGDIAPCCGFANENPQLFIGKITDTFETVINKAKDNKIVTLCYEKGLSTLKDSPIMTNKELSGKCSDICTFCDFVCKNYRH